MEFRKISDNKFQCLLYEEDLEENNISLDDFFRNDTVKIHSLLEVVMEEAHKSIGVELDGGVMSLQLAPQPNHSLLLTVSSGSEEIGDMIKHAGERAAQMISELKASKTAGNVIKKGDTESDDRIKAAPFKSMKNEEVEASGILAIDSEGNGVGQDNVIGRFLNLDDLEAFCESSNKTWGIKNMLYKDEDDGSFYLVLERARCSRNRFEQFVNHMIDYSEFILYSLERISYMKEHFQIYIAENAVNIIKKYCNS